MNRTDEIKNLFGGEIGSDIINTIKLKCPTTKFNLNPEDKYHIIGMGMMIEKNLENTLKLDLEDLNDNTIICLDNRQILEAIGIIDGALNLLAANKIVKDSDSIPCMNAIIKFITHNTITRYKYFKQNMYHISPNDYVNDDIEYTDTIKNCVDRFNFLIKNIWFVTYGDLDAFYEKTVKAFNSTGDSKNEDSSENN